MIKDLYLYGDIVPNRWFENSSEIDLKYLNEELSKLNLVKGDELRVNIHSMGGCTVTAFAMYTKLRRLASDGISVTTRVDGYCASSGVILLLAGDKRIGSEFAEPFVHDAWTYVFDEADAKKLRKIAEDLERVNTQIATLYNKRTSISIEDAIALMNAETWITPAKCLEYGFYTELEEVDAAPRDVFNSLRAKNLKNSNINNMNKPKGKAKNKLQNLLNAIKNYGAVNKIVLTAADEEVDFYELEADDTPEIGDKAMVGGIAAGDVGNGEFLMKTGETYVFSGEELTEIKAKATDDASDDETVENLTQQNTQLTTQLAAANNKLKALQAKYNKLKTEKATADGIINRIQNLSDDAIQNLLAEDEDDSDEDDDFEDDSDEDDDDFEDDGGFPAEKPRARATNRKPTQKVAKSEKVGSTRNILQTINANLFKS